MKTPKEIETRLRQEKKLMKRLISEAYQKGYAKGVMEDSEETHNVNGWIEALTWLLVTKKRGSL
jgi:hypothetical protein